MRPVDNPFATRHLDRLSYRFPGGEQERASLFAALEAARIRGALVGPKGHGKSTLLREIERHLRERGLPVWRLQLREGETRYTLKPPGPDEIILLDGAEQLSLPRWWHFRYRMRRARGLVITTHRPGRLPTLHRCTTTPAILRQLIKELGGSEKPESLFVKHRGNIREALFECYDKHTSEASLRSFLLLSRGENTSETVSPLERR